MPRMIDADEFRKEVQEYVFPITSNNLMGAADAYHRILHLLDDAPTIEAEPVVHGRWKGEGMGDYFCSLCTEIVCGNEYNYCPNCGAKMDGGEPHGNP